MHIQRALAQQPPAPGALLVIENIGNLVCPASFDLGEQLRIVVISTPEGDDKPLKYPDILVDADLLIISKSDLSAYVDFNIKTCIDNARRIRPGLEAMVVSAKTGAGLDQWLEWLHRQRHAFAQETSPAVLPSNDLR
jgi:hydrogenase nickel incorporation protein HypB